MRHNPFRGQITGLGFLVGALALLELAVLALMAGNRAGALFVIALAAAVLGAVALITIVVLVLLGRSYAPTIEAILVGANWAHWRYDMGEWERFIAQERRRNRSILGRAAGLLVVAILVVVVFSGTSDLGLNSASLLYLLVLGAALLIALAYNLGRWSLYAWRHEQSNEAYISPSGICRPDGYRPLRGFGRTLLRVAVVPGDPASLAFTCRVTALAGLALVRVPVQISVPVPVGREDEARALVSRFGSILTVG